ncbi:uncharacterized protein TNCT_349511 [Trichonephila clavata]|uniref:Uncharacterized protein n=1 Tax=Trichonephila clavata TaxID=2740835 RepID=A0A8X6FCG1_TRICU|nr:uncharacterized protein TNCT_349511 [Trichonephila clavata]
MSDVFKMLHYSQIKKTPKVSIVLYCVAMGYFSVAFIVLYFKTNLRMLGHLDIKNSIYVDEKFKVYCSIALDVWYAMNIYVAFSIGMPMVGYYYFVCIYMKLLLREFVSKTKVLIDKADYYTIFQIYRDISKLIMSFDDFFAYPAFVNVLCTVTGLFFSCYSLMFFTGDDSLSIIFLLGTIIIYFSMFFMIMLPASNTNGAIRVAQGTIASVPGWFPLHYKKLKIYVHTKFKHQELGLSLWKIYTIDKPLLISTLGALVSYGILLGTLGSIRNSKLN